MQHVTRSFFPNLPQRLPKGLNSLSRSASSWKVLADWTATLLMCFQHLQSLPSRGGISIAEAAHTKREAQSVRQQPQHCGAQDAAVQLPGLSPLRRRAHLRRDREGLSQQASLTGWMVRMLICGQVEALHSAWTSGFHLQASGDIQALIQACGGRSPHQASG